jgi:hypothetical protein
MAAQPKKKLIDDEACPGRQALDLWLEHLFGAAQARPGDSTTT